MYESIFWTGDNLEEVIQFCGNNNVVYNIDEQIAFCVFSYFLGENIRFLVQ